MMTSVGQRSSHSDHETQTIQQSHGITNLRQKGVSGHNTTRGVVRLTLRCCGDESTKRETKREHDLLDGDPNG